MDITTGVRYSALLVLLTMTADMWELHDVAVRWLDEMLNSVVGGGVVPVIEDQEALFRVLGGSKGIAAGEEKSTQPLIA